MKSTGFRALSLLGSSMLLAVLTGCAEMPRQNAMNAGQPVAHSDPSCNPVLAGAVGALAGAMFGKGKGHIAGAAIGAGIGAIACTAYNYHSRKVRDSRAVENEYAQQRGALPARNTIASYSSSLSPSSTVQAGRETGMQSHVVLIHGAQDTQPKVSEQLTIISPDGKPLSTVRKDAADLNGTGEYVTNFDFNLPKGIVSGRYTVRSTLFMDNQQVGTNDLPMLVVG